MKTQNRRWKDRELLRQFRDSGLSLEEFIKENDLTPVKLSYEEIKKDLISQAIQKGYVKGCRVKCLNGWHNRDGEMWENDNTVSYDLQSDGSFWIYGIHHYSLCIFKDGNWAEFIKEDDFIDSMFGNVMSQLDEISRDLKKIKKQLNKTNKSKQWQ